VIARLKKQPAGVEQVAGWLGTDRAGGPGDDGAVG
jgi:hypothetical protein